MRGIGLRDLAMLAVSTPVGGGGGTSPPEPLNITTSTGGTTTKPVSIPAYNTGDCVVAFCMTDWSTGSTPNLPTAGPNGETVVQISSPRGRACYFVATAGSGATTLTFDPSSGSNYSWYGLSFRLKAGDFDPQDPIYPKVSNSGSGTSVTNYFSTPWTSVLTDGIPIIVHVGSGQPESTQPTGWTSKLSHDYGTFYSAIFQSNSPTLNGDEPQASFTQPAQNYVNVTYVLNPTNGSVPALSPGYNYRNLTTSDTTQPPGLHISLPTYNGVSGTPSSAVGSGGSGITGYRVEYKKATDSTWTVAATNQSVFPFLISTPTGGETYNIRLAAVNASGTSPLYYTQSIFVGLPPSQVASTFTVTPKSGYFKITNITEPNGNGNSVNFSEPFKLRYRVSGSGIWLDAFTENADYSFQKESGGVTWEGLLFGLTNGTTYEFALAAQNSVGVGAYSTTATVTPTNSAAHADDNGVATYTEYPLRAWTVASDGYDTDEIAIRIGRHVTSAKIGTEEYSNDFGSGVLAYQLILEYDTTCQGSGIITAGNVIEPILQLVNAGGNFTVEMWNGPSFNPKDSARAIGDSFTRVEMGIYTFGASRSVTGLTGAQAMVKNGFNLNAVSGTVARTYVRLTSNNQRTNTLFTAFSNFNPWLCAFNFKVS